MANQDPIAGVWYSGVGSMLKLQVDGSELKGSFDSTEAHGGSFTVHGSVDPDPSKANRALSFSVCWIRKNGHPKYRSVTSYTGQYHKLENGSEYLNTTFLMVDETTPEQDYASTYVGYDNFNRNKP